MQGVVGEAVSVVPFLLGWVPGFGATGYMLSAVIDASHRHRRAEWDSHYDRLQFEMRCRYLLHSYRYGKSKKFDLSLFESILT